MNRRNLSLAALLASVLSLVGPGCGAGVTPPASMTARVESSAVADEPVIEPASSDSASPEPPKPPSPELLKAIEEASLRSAAAIEEAAKPDPDEGRPVSSGTCVGPASRAAQKKVRSQATCCYIAPSYFMKRVRAKNEEFRACYNEALKRRPDLHGRIATKFSIEEDGSVAGVCDAGSTVGDPAMVACLLRVFTTLTFEAYTVGDPCPAVTVTYPMRFSPNP